MSRAFVKEDGDEAKPRINFGLQSRRDPGFPAAAALALIIALTDFNFSYLSDSTEVGLLVEGLILLAAGFGVSKLRQRIGGGETPVESARLPAPA